jgi:tetrahydrodipicolinate N-succinyltransferase
VGGAVGAAVVVGARVVGARVVVGASVVVVVGASVVVVVGAAVVVGADVVGAAVVVGAVVVSQRHSQVLFELPGLPDRSHQEIEIDPVPEKEASAVKVQELRFPLM